MTVSTPELDQNSAQFIYSLMAIGLSNEAIFQKNNLESQTWIIHRERILYVRNEFLALHEVARSSMMRVGGEFERIIGNEDESVEPIKELYTIEPSPSSKTELESELHSDLIDISVFVKDFMDYILNYKKDTTWEEFEEQFIYLKNQNEI